MSSGWGVAPRRFVFLAAVLLLASVACGRSRSSADGTTGTPEGGADQGGDAGMQSDAGSPTAGGSGGNTSGGTSSGGAPSGGTSSGGTSAGRAGSPGSGAAGVAGNPSTCEVVPSKREGCDGCTLNAAFALRCPSPFSSLEVAGANLLVGHANGAELFGFHFEGGLVALGAWDAPAQRRELTAGDDDAPIVVHQLDGTISIDPGPRVDGGVDLATTALLDASFDDGTLRVLDSTPSGIVLWSFAADGAASATLVSAQASSGAAFVAGSGPPEVMFGSDELWLWSLESETAEPIPNSLPVGPLPRSASALALEDRLIIAQRALAAPRGARPETAGTGTISVNDAGMVSISGAPRALQCPGDYVANYPDICEFESIDPALAEGAIIAFDLVVHDEQPWLVAIVGDVTDRCEPFSGGCIETRPCDCGYQRTGSTARAELRLISLDQPSRVLSLELGSFPYENVSLDAASSSAGAIFVAIAEPQFTSQGSHGGTAVDYLMLTPR